MVKLLNTSKLILENYVLKHRRLWLLQNSCFFSKHSDSSRKKVPNFELSIDEAGKSKVETETRDVSLTALYKAKESIKKQKEEESVKPKTRRLYIWDKHILVKLGKYKRVEDVPDEITFNPKKDKNLEGQVRAELKEKMFKRFIGLDYILWMICILVAAYAYYLYSTQYKSTESSKGDRSI